MTAFEAGTIIGTLLTVAIVLMIAVLLGVSLYRRIKYPKQKHMNPVLYWILFVLGSFYVLSSFMGLFS